jgi:hypothetical protein
MAEQSDKKYVEVWCECCEGRETVLMMYSEFEEVGGSLRGKMPHDFYSEGPSAEYYYALCPKCKGKGYILYEEHRVCKTCKRPF